MSDAATVPGGTFVEVEVTARESVTLPPAATALAPATISINGGGGGPLRPVGEGPRTPPPPWQPPPGVPEHRSTYLQYLPGIYEDNEFLARYLLIFESILGPITRTVDNVPHIFDSGITPRDLLSWLGGWIGVVADERWPEGRRRELIQAAPSLYRWRGTRRGMAEFVRLCTGFEAEIIEPNLSEVASHRARAFHFTVRLRVPRGTEIDRAAVQAVIDLEKPAFASGKLEVVEAE